MMFLHACRQLFGLSGLVDGRGLLVGVGRLDVVDGLVLRLALFYMSSF